MITDYENTMSNDQEITDSAASTHVIDLGETSPTFDGKLPRLLVRVTETFATCTSVTFTLQTDSTAAFSSPTSVRATSAIAVASLVAGYDALNESLPASGLERYIRVYYTVAGSSATAGEVFAGLLIDAD